MQIDKIDKLLKNEGLRRAGSFESGWNVTLWIDNTAVVVWATDAPIELVTASVPGDNRCSNGHRLRQKDTAPRGYRGIRL